MSRPNGWALALAGLVLLAGPAFVAQAQSPSDVALARELFETGVRAATEHRWDDARAAFERSYAIARTFNPAVISAMSRATIS